MEEFIISINESLQKINRAIGNIEGKVSRAIELHETCPARLGYPELKESTKKIRKDSSDNISTSIIPKSLNMKVIQMIGWILFALMAGAAFTGYMISDSGKSLDIPKKISLPNPDHSNGGQ